ncbi:hypothetical protein [uncultured Sphaerochaeta sp.]|uniref:hypothetical protein n=1 Tax=uncultured Sphaerochaeta sp. TaxID=886478 RepID=UPI00260E613C|nr:hypothetical protein [uncultured Sphaerochaeta sp.]
MSDRVLKTFRVEVIIPAEKKDLLLNQKKNILILASVLESVAAGIGVPVFSIDGSVLDIDKPDDVYRRDLENTINNTGGVANQIKSIIANGKTPAEKIDAVEDFLYNQVDAFLRDKVAELRKAREADNENDPADPGEQEFDGEAAVRDLRGKHRRRNEEADSNMPQPE